MGYDPERDVENTADSVFCSHGAGVGDPVAGGGPARPGGTAAGARRGRSLTTEGSAPPAAPVRTYAGTAAQDKELQAIFERTSGAVKRESFLPPKAPKRLWPIIRRKNGEN